MEYFNFPSSVGSSINSPANQVSPKAGSTSGGGYGAVASGVISGLTDIGLSFVNASRIKNTYKFNQGMADLQKRLVRIGSDVAIKNIRKQAQSMFGEQKAGYAKAGLSFEGSPMAVMLNTQKEYELSAIYEGINADLGISSIEGNSAINTMQMKSAISDQYIGMGKTVLNMFEKALVSGAGSGGK
jgi:hypothetical protein